MNQAAVVEFVSGLPWDGLPRGSAAELARSCNLSEASVTKWRHGRSMPSAANWRAIEEMFRLRPRSIAEAAAVQGTPKAEQMRHLATQLSSIRRMMSALDEQMARLEREFQDIALK